MPAFPAQCPDCQTIFPFHGIGVEGGANVQITLRGNVTSCPACGSRRAQISDGVFQANNSAIGIISAPQSTHAAVEALKLIAERAAAGAITKDVAIQQANEISPKYGPLLERYYQLGMPALAMLVSLIALYLQLEGNRSSSEDANKMLNALNEQTFVMKEIRDENRVGRERAALTKIEAGKKPISTKNASRRRTEVYRMRREQLKRHRDQFGGGRGH